MGIEARHGVPKVFLVELSFVLVVAPKKIAALRAHWLDLAIVAVTVPALGSFLSSLRLVRLARLTVGYGDFYPSSIRGRIVAMVVMLAGIWLPIGSHGNDCVPLRADRHRDR